MAKQSFQPFMMDYYEELGLERSASTQEIRKAYKRMVRLLHPDQCRDAALRRMADLQMKRLNEVQAILTNPMRRAKYDRVLAIGPAGPEKHAPLVRKVPTWAWPAASGLAMMVLMVLLVCVVPARPPAVVQPPEPAVITAKSPPPVAAKAVRVQHPVTAKLTPQVKPVSPVVTPDPAPPIARAIPEAASLGTEAAIGHLLAVTPPAALPTRPIHPQRPQGLAGEWLFVPPLHAHEGGLYPPEYIEVHITEESGVVHGRYPGRYRISDQAISPNVIFQFDGTAGADGGTMSWRGAGGSQGEVTLRLLTSGALEVTWVADRLGQELGLVSGTAVLVRKLD